jgi:hypothetical protein
VPALLLPLKGERERKHCARGLPYAAHSLANWAATTCS